MSAPQAFDAGPEIEADTNSSEESDGYYSATNASSTTSLSSSVTSYVYENGRRYHAFRAGAYVLPNDDTEQDRLDLLHHVFNMLNGGELLSAPVKDPQRILDIGTGTGIWAIDVADQFPGAQVVANDLSPIQPGWVPPNLTFEVDDAESEWVYSGEGFDLIHMRTMGGSIKDWPRLLEQAYQHTKPGGYIEIVEVEMRVYCDDSTVAPDSPVPLLMKYQASAASMLGLNFNAVDFLPGEIEKVGFKITEHSQLKVPYNPWAKDPKMKEIARYFNANLSNAIDAYCLQLFTGVLGWNREKYEAFMVGVRRDVKDRGQHGYTICHRIIGRKPDGEQEAAT